MQQLIDLVNSLISTNIFAAFFLSYLGGLLTTFTPCVYPMIPVTLAITLGTDKGSDKDKWKKLFAPFMYCLGITTAYALLGVFAAATGTFFGKWAGNPWIYFALAAVFVVLALNALDIVHLPTLNVRYKADRAHVLSLFLFGALTGLVFSPCTAPMMGIFLTYAATQSLVGGGFLLFGYAAGFSSLLLVMAWLSLYAKDRIPRSGQWMTGVKWSMVMLCIVIAMFLLHTGIGLLSQKPVF